MSIEEESAARKGAQIANVSSVGFPRSLSNALMIRQHPKPVTLSDRLHKIWFTRWRRVP